MILNRSFLLWMLLPEELHHVFSVFSLEIWTKSLMLMKIRSPFTFIQAEGHPLRQCMLVILSHLYSQSKLFLPFVLIKTFFSKEVLNVAYGSAKMIHCEELCLSEVNINEPKQCNLTFSLKLS